MTLPALSTPDRPLVVPTTPRQASGLRVLGLDLSITSTGIALPTGATCRIKTRTRDADRRLCIIRDHLRRILTEHQPHCAVIEDLPTKMRPTAVKGVGALHGVVKAELLDAGVPYAMVAPATLKSYACDHGRAEKHQLADAAYLAAGATFPDDRGGDQCDAWWLRAAAHHHYDRPLFDLPAAQRARLRKVDWPAITIP
ncbi:crossover junction endodeoxyribonuclease RuvC [Streptomyces nanshensis]|uniref:Uncharacterized protein n=1 Tax=Streptomyces nanshensis TaxID=518642 RepID=A0A1E7LD46_9ACTN|nr:crossover junction endodeoxyribonuclease RuvC [Streptomyces nanshensis]OEV14074.1 hypothetical protein AN218_00955 [Streptomyces nanshensis]